MHTVLHPTVRAIVARLAVEYRIGFVRAPVEPLMTFLRCQSSNLSRTLARGLVFGPWGRWCRARLRHAGVRTADRVVGILNAGRLTEEFLLAYAPQVPGGVTEVVFHPAAATTANLAQRQPGYAHVGERNALCSSRLRAALAANGIRLTNFGELADPGEMRQPR